VGPNTERDLIHVGLEDIIFTVAGFNLYRNQQFMELSFVRALETKEQIFGQLLGNGRGPLNLSGFEQGHPQSL